MPMPVGIMHCLVYTPCLVSCVRSIMVQRSPSSARSHTQITCRLMHVISQVQVLSKKSQPYTVSNTTGSANETLELEDCLRPLNRLNNLGSLSPTIAMKRELRTRLFCSQCTQPAINTHIYLYLYQDMNLTKLCTITPRVWHCYCGSQQKVCLGKHTQSFFK